MKSEMCRQLIVNLIEQIECNNERQDDVDRIYNVFINNVLNEMNVNIPYTEMHPKSKKFFKTHKPFWNDELKDLWSQMNTAEKLLRKAVNGQDKRLKHTEFRMKQHQFDRRFRFFERKYKYEQCDNIETLNTTDPKQFWEKLNSLGPKKKQIIPLEVYDENNNIVRKKQAVLDKWKAEFSGLYNDSDQINDFPFCNQIRTNIKVLELNQEDPLFDTNLILNGNISREEVKAIIRKAKYGKSVGIDRLPYEVFRNDLMIGTLVKLFQLLLDTG